MPVNCEETSFVCDGSQSNAVIARILLSRVECVRHNLGILEQDQSNRNRDLPVSSEYGKSNAPLNPEAWEFELMITEP